MKLEKNRPESPSKKTKVEFPTTSTIEKPTAKAPATKKVYDNKTKQFKVVTETLKDTKAFDASETQNPQSIRGPPNERLDTSKRVKAE